MLFRTGGNSALALKYFIENGMLLSDALFEDLLALLVENARPISSVLPRRDLFYAIIRSQRVLLHHPEALKNLLSRKVFSQKLLSGDGKCDFDHSSYMYKAISRRLPVVVDLLLQHGAQPNGHVYDPVPRRISLTNSFTWLTLAVMYGSASCADPLIQHGADPIALDKAGRSAVQLAMSNAVASHPRTLALRWYLRNQLITYEEDAETLAVIEQAFNLKFQGTTRISDFLKPDPEADRQAPMQQVKATSLLPRMSEKILRLYLSPGQIARLQNRIIITYLDYRELWSLPFYEALLIRLVYVLS
ncbi:hypothetical protein MMC28_008814 [Mycoblastus sanguinarius]|nr:hypothetical protein [Mycoblastus sanguinarius]